MNMPAYICRQIKKPLHNMRRCINKELDYKFQCIQYQTNTENEHVFITLKHTFITECLESHIRGCWVVILILNSSQINAVQIWYQNSWELHSIIKNNVLTKKQKDKFSKRLPVRKRWKEARCPLVWSNEECMSLGNPFLNSSSNKFRSCISIQMRVKGPINSKSIFSCFYLIPPSHMNGIIITKEFLNL